MFLLPASVVMVLLLFINIAMVVARLWSIEIAVVIGTAPVVVGIAAIALVDLMSWRRRQPKPLPRATAVRS